MTAILRTGSRLLVAVLFCALVAVFTPAQAKPQAANQPSCCSHLQIKMDKDSGCAGHAQGPMKPQDASCCQACSLGLALLFATPAPFVYAQTGVQLLVSQNARSHSLPHPPPVPPPRCVFA